MNAHDQTRLDTISARIVAHITDPEDRDFATRQLGSLRDYLAGDEQACTWQAALENCEQIKGYFPASIPKEVLEELDAVARDLLRSHRQQKPWLARALTNPWIVVLIGIVVAAILISSR